METAGLSSVSGERDTVHSWHRKCFMKPGVEVHTLNLSILNAEAGGSLESSRPLWSIEGALRQPGLPRETLSQTKQANNNNNKKKVLHGRGIDWEADLGQRGWRGRSNFPTELSA
jgi:hypothetical protein